MSALESLKIANPCSADWETMRGTDAIRHCDACALNVYNISDMTTAEAEALIENAEGRLCVRLYKRADGTVITRDCPVGAARKRRRMTVIAAAFTGVLSLGAAFAAFALRRDAVQCSNPNPQASSTVQPFKTLAKYFPNMLPQPTPPPQLLLGDVEIVP